LSDATFGTRFRHARQQKQLTQVAVAKALGVSQSAVAQWEAGRSFPSSALAPQIEQLLGIDSRMAEGDQPMQARAPQDTRARLPVIGLPAPGDDTRIIIDDNPHGEILAPPQLEDITGAKAVYVRGRSMEPRYYPGEVVYLHPTRVPNPGDFVLVTLKEPGFPSPIGYIRQFLGADLVHVRFATLNPKSEHLVARDDMVGLATIVGSGLF
jgi:transcriptional regulator with XRE-family HTH domain